MRFPLAQINAVLKGIKGTRLLNQEITSQEANITAIYKQLAGQQGQKELYVLLIYFHL